MHWAQIVMIRSKKGVLGLKFQLHLVLFGIKFTVVQKKNGSKGAFSHFFNRQQSKVGSPPQVGKVLTTLAEDDLKRIASLIQNWLNKDEQEKAQLNTQQTTKKRKH